MNLKWWMLLLVAFAIYYIALAVFNLQFTLLKSQLYCFQCSHSLFEVLTMNNYIIGITLKLYLRMALFNPLIKCKKMFANSGLITPPCGVPLVRFSIIPSLF